MTSHSLDLCGRDTSSLSFSDKVFRGQVVREKVLPRKSFLEDKRSRVVEIIRYPRGLFARHLLRLHLSSEELFLTLHTPGGELLQELSLKDRNLELLSPKEAAKRIKTLGLHNLTFVLHKSPWNTQDRDTIQAYLLPKLQGAMDPSAPAKEKGKSTDREFSFYRERSLSLQEAESQTYDEHDLMGIIKGKLANFLADPFHVGLKEFKRAVDLLINEFDRLKAANELGAWQRLFEQVPWEGFLHGCSLFKKLSLENKELEELHTYCERLCHIFYTSSCVRAEKEQSSSLEARFLGIFQEITTFFQEQEDYLQEQRYLTLSLVLTTSPVVHKKLLLEGGERALFYAEKKRGGEDALASAEEEEYRKPESFQRYEDASTYFAAAYHLTTKYEELASSRAAAFEKLYDVQGRYLSAYLPQKGEDCETYAYGYKIRSAEIKRSFLPIKEKQELVQEMENAADYLEACGYFKLAYCIYDQLYEEFQGVPEFQVNKYLAITTELGKESSAKKAKERFLKKIEQYRAVIREIRKESLAIVEKGSVTLEEQKEISQRYQMLIKELFCLCKLILDPRGKYSYALMVVGSLARYEMCPFSDFELALILEKEEDRAHFRKVGELFHLLVLSLGETKLAIIGREEMLPQGFSLDQYNNPLRLCGTAETLANRQMTTGGDPVQLNVLRSGAFLTGKRELFEMYHTELMRALNAPFQEGAHISWGRQRALGVIKASLKLFNGEVLSNPQVLNIKEDLLRLCVFAFENLCLYYSIPTCSHTVEKIQALTEKDLFPKALQQPFEEYLNFAFALRWKAHLKENEEQDTYSVTPDEKEKVICAYRTLLRPLKDTLDLWLSKEEDPKERAGPLSENSTSKEALFSQGLASLPVSLSGNKHSEQNAFQNLLFFATAYFEQAQTTVSRGDFDQALFYTEKAVLLKEDPQYFKLCGELYFTRGDFKKAQELWQKSSAFFTEKFLFLPSFTSLQDELSISLEPSAEEIRINASRGEWNKQKKLHLDLIELAKEQEKVQHVLKEAYTRLKIGNCWCKTLPVLSRKVLENFSEWMGKEKSAEELSSPTEVAEEAIWKKALNMVEQKLSSFSCNQEEAFSCLIPLWEQCLTIWLQFLQHSEEFLEIFKSVYLELPKSYRQEIRTWIVSLYPHKLSLLQNLYCEEGYVFSAAAKRYSWLRHLQREVVKDSDRNRSLSFVGGLYLSRGYFSKDMENTLFEGSQTFKKTVAWGNRLVTQAQGSFFKKNPESPGDEYAVFLLNHLITGQGSPPVELLGVVNKQSHLLLASQQIKEEPLNIFLSKHPEALSKIDKKQFSQMILMALLIDPEDGKADNYIAQYTQNAQGKITNVQIIGIDNDHVFVKPFVQKGVILQDTQLFIKTILFCFDEMKESLHPEVVSSYLQLDVRAILEEWLKALCDYNMRAENLIGKSTLNRYWREKILIPFFMHPDQVLYLHEKMIRLQHALKQSKKAKSHLDLLNLLNPRLAATYASAFNQPSSPIKRFETITEDAYKKVKGVTLTMTTTSQIKQYTFKDPLQSIEEFKEKGFTPEQSLKILSRLADHRRFKEITDKSIDSLQQDLKQILTTPLQEELLEKQDWSKIPFADLSIQLGKFAKVPLRRANLSNCKALTDELLMRFIEGCRHPITEEIELQRLNLQGCTSLTNKAIAGIRRCRHLKRLNLEGTNLEKLELEQSLASLKLLILKDCKKLAFLEVDGPLVKLSLQGCTQLQKLYLYCPNLKTLLLHGVPSNLKYWASKETLISATLFFVLRHAQNEVEFTLNHALNKLFVEDFMRSLQTNTSLKCLSIDLADCVDSVLEFSDRIDLRGHPTLERLYINFPLLKVLNIENAAFLKVLRLENSLRLTNTSFLIKELCGIKTIVELDLRKCGGLQPEHAQLLIDLPNLERLSVPFFILEYQNECKQTLLHLAVLAQKRKLILDLASQGIRLTAKDILGKTPLQLAISNGDEETRALLERAEHKKIEGIVFGKKDWERYFGDVENEIPLPENILEILEGACPIWSEKRVEDTHLLTFIPSTVNGKFLTLDYLEELVQSPKRGGHATKYAYYWEEVKSVIGAKSVDFAYWVFITKDVLPNTRGEMYKNQCEQIARWNKKTEVFQKGGYRVPKVLEVAISVLMEYVRSGERLYSDPKGFNGRWTCTRCEEIGYRGWQVLIGGFDASGLDICDPYDDSICYGVGAAHKI